MKEEIISIVVKRLGNQFETLRACFLGSSNEVGSLYCVLDTLLPEDIADRIHKVFPTASSMRLMDSLREQKYKLQSFDSIGLMATQNRGASRS